MKKQHILAVFAVCLCALLLALRFLPTGTLTAFSYESGHAWSGNSGWEIMQTEDGPQAVYFYEPGMMSEAEEAPWSASLPLSGDQMDEISDIVLRQLKLPLWPNLLMAPDAPTDMDGWSITFTWNGHTYKKAGYDRFPSGLKRVTGFFRALPFPNAPENG